MEEKLISKRELLEKYGISYGALYRWKRKGLIPEEWFIRKSTVTGQETFFPCELVCARMEEILSQKDEASLDELARRFVQNTEEEGGCLVIRTKYGDKSFRLSDIQSVSVITRGEEEKDITSILKTIL